MWLACHESSLTKTIPNPTPLISPVVAIVSSRLMLGEDFRFGEVTGILLIGAGLALLSLIGWAASRSSPMK